MRKDYCGFDSKALCCLAAKMFAVAFNKNHV